MFFDPKKITASLLVSAVILALGMFALGTQSPKLAISRLLPPLAISDTFETAERAETVASDSLENSKIKEQISPENATMEAEAMMASVDAVYPVNNNDWSLELISDQALEIN